eukprot:JZ548882.1.p2 GENE.JZ548882.1~~JZ548882.1.p2  ORF type:complete len:93 (-),score=14.42 JZ548882.1:203-481(-)
MIVLLHNITRFHQLFLRDTLFTSSFSPLFPFNVTRAELLVQHELWDTLLNITTDLRHLSSAGHITIVLTANINRWNTIRRKRYVRKHQCLSG